MKAKHIVLGAASAALIAALSIGGTLAYLSAVTETKTNVFTSADSIFGEIQEESWDPATGGSYQPGDIIAKDPVLYNLSETDAYAAIKVQITDQNGQVVSLQDFETKYGKFMNQNGGYGVNDGWEAVSMPSTTKEVLYVLKGTDGNLTKISKGNPSPALFNSIEVSYGLKQEWTGGDQTVSVYKEIPAADYVAGDGYKTVVNGGKTKYYKLESVDKTTVSPTTVYYLELSDGTLEPTSLLGLPTFNVNVTGYMVQAETDQAQALENLKEIAFK